MALQINKEIVAFGGITLPSVYGRIEYQVDFSGSNIQARIKYYVSKEAYKASEHNNISLPNIHTDKNYSIKYNYMTDIDNNIILYIHKHIIDDLTIDKTSKVAKQDASLNYMVDELGNKIMEDFLITPKFCELSDVSIVDL